MVIVPSREFTLAFALTVMDVCIARLKVFLFPVSRDVFQRQKACPRPFAQ